MLLLLPLRSLTELNVVKQGGGGGGWFTTLYHAVKVCALDNVS